jgi:transposase
LDRPRAGEERLRELRLLVDHRDDLVDERRRAQQRLRWHLHELDPLLGVPAERSIGPSGWTGLRASSLAVSRRCRCGSRATWSARCRALTRTILELERELAVMTTQTAPGLLELPGCGAVTAAKLLAEIGPIERFQTDAQLARHGGAAPLEASSGRVRRHRLDRGGNRQLNCALHRIAVTQSRVHPAARAYLERKQAEGKRAAARRSAASNANSHASSSTPSKRAQP